MSSPCQAEAYRRTPHCLTRALIARQEVATANAQLRDQGAAAAAANANLEFLRERCARLEAELAAAQAAPELHHHIPGVKSFWGPHVILSETSAIPCHSCCLVTKTGRKMTGLDTYRLAPVSLLTCQAPYCKIVCNRC